jgi:hypothetical protein
MKKRFKHGGRDGRLLGLSDYLIYIAISLVFMAGMSGIFEQNAYSQTSTGGTSSKVQINEGDEWHYFKGIQEPPRGWNSSGFDHSNWLKGPSGLGYGSGMNKTYLGDMKGNYLSVYASREFTLGYEGVSSMALSVVCDGPFVAYLNSIEVIRSNATRKANRPAEKLDISGFAHEAVPGTNVLSVKCSNDDINSADLSFVPTFEYTEKQGGY